MRPALKGEYLKLKTVRSTYIISLLLLVLLGFISFWASGYKNNDTANPHFLESALQAIAPITSIVGALIAVLLMAHEYRYNTIIYTLSASNSRSKVLAAKIVVVFLYVFLLTLFIGGISLALAILGNDLAGHPLPHQDINLVNFFGRAIFYCEGFALVGLMVAALIRNLVFSIVFLLIAPNTVEGLLNLLLKEDSKYLPFSALSQVISQPSAESSSGPFVLGHLSPLKGAAIFSIYFIAGWVVTWLLFLKRDAN